jgi:hypothetical protein
MVIKKIKISKIENDLKMLSEESSGLKMLQEELENLNKNLKNINFGFFSGKLSKDMYEKTKADLEKRKRPLIDDINKKVDKILTISGNLSKTINENKI